MRQVKTFCQDYRSTKRELLTSSHSYFRYTCFKFIDYIKLIELPAGLTKGKALEAVLIEFRSFPHVEFLVRNNILKLGSKWSYTIVCGTDNYEFMKDMATSISSAIRVIRIEKENMLPDMYNEMLTSLSFWEMLSGEKILIYQEDSILFHKNIDEFLRYDFIGAPFPASQNDTPNCVGNGGFSLRSKSVMIKIISEKPLKKTVFERSTLKYMRKHNLKNGPEDVYFSKNMQELGIGTIPDAKIAGLFSSESIYNEKSLGGHKFWISDKRWLERMRKSFGFLPSYSPSSDIEAFLKYQSLPIDFNRTKTVPNAFDVDFFLCNNVNNLMLDRPQDISKYVKLIAVNNGTIYHMKQIQNIFPDICTSVFMNNVFILYHSQIYIANAFVQKYLYNSTYDQMHNRLIRCLHYNLDRSFSSLLLLVFIGNWERGYDLIQRILQYKKIQSFNIAFCFNVNVKLSKYIKDLIHNNFSHYAVYESLEMGTDITPTLLMYDDILTTRKTNFDHIIKLQSKSIINQYLDLTNYLLTKRLDKLILQKRPDCHCVGHNKYYINLFSDPYNNDLKMKHISQIYPKNTFVGGTIFYSPSDPFNKVVELMKKNYKIYLFNNLYENNSINRENSPIHFLERLFGTIKINDET